jgi:hypothetical protein
VSRFVARSLLFSVSLAAFSTQGLAAQAGAFPRVIVAPQVGAVVGHSSGSDANVAASVVAEMPVGRGWSLAAEWTRPYGGYAQRVCLAIEDVPCVIGAELRSAGGIGVVVRPVRVGPFEPYAGVSGGAARWARNDDSGVAPLASLRAGLDVHVAGPFGLRADLVRRVAWTDTPNGSPMHVDMFSVGARFAFRR